MHCFFPFIFNVFEQKYVFCFSFISLRWIYGKEIRFFNRGSKRELSPNVLRHLLSALSYHLSIASKVVLVTIILGELRKQPLTLFSVFCGSHEEHWLRMLTFLRFFALIANGFLKYTLKIVESISPRSLKKTNLDFYVSTQSSIYHMWK